MRRTLFAGLLFVAACAFASPAHSQWSVTYLHPAGAAESWGTGVSGVDQVGRITNPGSSNTFAALWTGSAASFANLNPVGATSSRIDGTDGVHQVGSIVGNAMFHAYPPQYAGVWSGTAASFVNLQPTTGGIYEPWSHAVAVEGSIQAGDYEASTEPATSSAGIWHGTSASYTPLSSPGFSYTAALGTDGVSVVGAASSPTTPPLTVTHAALWLSASTFIDLNPAGATSSIARDVEGNVQVGSATSGGATHAAMWLGSAATFTDFNPAGAVGSVLNGIDGTYEAGTATFGTTTNAGFWSGTAGSFVNLHAFLTPGTYSTSEALGIWTNGTTIKIVGSAFNSVLSRNEAILWTVTVPEPGTITLTSIGIVAACARRRRKRA